MSFDALSQIEKHEAAELLYLKKAKEQRKAANVLRKTLNIKQEAEVVSIEESAVPDVVVALPLAVLPLASAAMVTLPESPLSSPAQMPRDFKELPMQPQAPGAPVKKARKPLTAEHLAKFQAGRKAWLEKKHAAATEAKEEPLIAKELDFSDVAAAIGVPAAEKLWASASPTASEEAPAAIAAVAAVAKKERKPLSDERLAYLKSAEHLAKMKAGKEKKRAATAASAVAPAPENEMVVGESPPASTSSTTSTGKIYKLKGSSEERTAIIANLPLGRACGKGDAVINWRKGTKHYPLSKWPAAILEQLALGVCTKEAICTATLLSLKNFDDFVRELKHQNLME